MQEIKMLSDLIRIKNKDIVIRLQIEELKKLLKDTNNKE